VTPTSNDYHKMTWQPLDDSFQRRLIDDVSRSQNLDLELAQRIIDQTLIFLKLIADNPGQSYAPSPLVDIGWHAFILHTQRYSDFCRQIAGGFIHHYPRDDEEGRQREFDSSRYDVSRTTLALIRANLPVDNELWNGTGKCGGVGCTNGDCTSGGPP
jgi:hypothetical protein